MRVLTSLGVSHQEKDGQSFWKKICFSVVYYIFPVMVKVLMSVCVNSSLVLSPSASCVTCVGFFLHCCSLIKELAVAQFFLFHNCMTELPCSFAVIIRSIYCVCFQHCKLVNLSVSQIYFDKSYGSGSSSLRT